MNGTRSEAIRAGEQAIAFLQQQLGYLASPVASQKLDLLDHDRAVASLNQYLRAFLATLPGTIDVEEWESGFSAPRPLADSLFEWDELLAS